MKLGIIGFGNRAQHVVSEILRLDPSSRIAAITDIQVEKVKDKLGEKAHDIEFFTDPDQMLDSLDFDGLVVGTRCSLHTKMALKVLPRKIPLFLEKPVATNLEDLIRLKQGNESYNPKVVVSFPLRSAPIVRLAKEIIESGRIGTIEHAQVTNNVPYGGVYFQNWYRDEEETQGLFLQKATHDFDYINYLLDLTPISIAAMKSKQIFKGSKPAGLKCVDCSEQDTCLESAVLKRRHNEVPVGEYCCFAEDTGNEDSGSALIRYDSGMHVSYSQNFFARNKAAQRGARLLGYKGTLEFDFYTNTIKVFMHHSDRVETYELGSKGNHFNGDEVLAQNFIEVMQGRAEPISPLDAGIQSALMCLKATASAENHRFEEITF